LPRQAPVFSGFRRYTMKSSIQWLALAVLAAASVWWLSGCTGGSGTDSKKDQTKQTGQREGGHQDHKDQAQKDHKEQGHKDGHDHDKPLTEKDVKMPESFKDGVARLEELHKKIDHQIEHGELPKVHRVAEEMALVARKMKELAQKDVAEDKRVEAGRLCNEIAGYFKPIDEAADAGRKAETEAIHKKMGKAIENLKALAK
jgi:hypothetical protein